ncbi:MAG: phosphoglucosamine mutase [Phycisphaerales bacterium]|nr:phosphoglucosamine mutase [Phycisphaerales bacterium]
MSDPFMLGISGCRGIVGSTMTPQVAARLAACWGERLKAEHSDPLVVIGRDSRPSGAALGAAAASALTSIGCRVVDLGIVATPTAGVVIGALQAAGGVLITASHNPGQWNGVKLLDHRGTAPPADLAGSIVERYNAGGPEGIDAQVTEDVPFEGRANDTHVAKVLGRIPPMRVASAAPRVLLDSVRGAGGPAGRRLLEAMGCDLVHLEAEPDGAFPRSPEPTAENLAQVGPKVVQAGAAVGFVQDPDADRLALLDEQGRYIGEEYTLALAAWAVLRDRPGVAAANLSTSRMIDDVAQRFGSTVVRTAVGEANVAQAMREQSALIGGEGNGGVILPEVTWVRDSLSGMALVLDLMAAEQATLSQLVDQLPSYAMVKQKVPLPDRDALEPALERLQRAFAEEQIDDSDGVRIDLDQGWVHLRPSNTEPIARLIAEASDRQGASELAQRVARAAGLAC